MNKENVQKLITALRSNTYKQGRKYLHYKDCFCVLGVACDLYNPTWEPFLHDPSVYYHMDTHRSSNPPDEVTEYYGIDYDLANQLMHMNDDGYSFNQIADYLETQLNDHA